MEKKELKIVMIKENRNVRAITPGKSSVDLEGRGVGVRISKMLNEDEVLE
jgi:hypothetical protein